MPFYLTAIRISPQNFAHFNIQRTEISLTSKAQLSNVTNNNIDSTVKLKPAFKSPMRKKSIRTDHNQLINIAIKLRILLENRQLSTTLNV